MLINRDGSKTYINLIAESRNELAARIGSVNFTINNGLSYNVNEVYAETTSSDTAAGTVIGGVVGLLGGFIGVLAGATIGGFIGNNSEQEDKSKVRMFNLSHVDIQPFNSIWSAYR